MLGRHFKTTITAHFSDEVILEIVGGITGPVEEVEGDADGWRKNGQIVYNPFTGQPL